MGEISDNSDIMEKFFHFVKNEYSTELADVLNKGKKSLIIDFQKLDMYEPDLAESLIEEPEIYIDLFQDSLVEFEETVSEKIFIRFVHLPVNTFIEIRNIRSKDLGKLMFTEGTVRQASSVRPTCTMIIYQCLSCEQKISVVQDITFIKEPEKCPQCGKRHFKVLKQKLVDTQRLILEESSDSIDGGQPMRLNIFLKNDLVDPKIVKKTTPGSKIRIAGVIHEFAKQIAGTKNKSVIYDIFIQANSVESIEQDYSDIVITNEDIEQIKLMGKDPMIYTKLIKSIAPTIKGRFNEKEAIILQMFGGVRKKRKDGTITRGDIHLLFIGDPGTGKSQLVKGVTSVAPKSRFVSGKGASGAGLTATVVKDDILKGWALEAGALVLANKGILCIDEIDKMTPEDRSAMHEAMEQQTISISKANVQAVLNCQTSIIAAANPKHGRFDGYRPLPDQIDMPVTLLSRFDLIFPFIDTPDKEKDSQLAEFILKSHQDSNLISPAIPTELLRKYVSYVKQHIKPKLTDEAIKEMQNFYVGLRNRDTMGEGKGKSVAITARQLEALVRLSEASARIRLAKEVLREDAKRAIGLMKLYLLRLGMDPDTQELDIDRVMSKTTHSQRSKLYEIIDIIKGLETQFGNKIPLGEIIDSAKNKGIDEQKAEDIISKMKRNGELFEPSHGFVQRTNR